MDTTGENLGQRNPWITEGSLSSLRNVLAMAESAGTLHKLNVLETEDHQKELYQTSPTLKMIAIQKEIRDLKGRLHQVNLDIQRHLQDKETNDITHVDVLEHRIAKVKETSCHLETIVRQKNMLISRLQKPFVNDFLQVEASYQRYACETLQQLVPVVSDLPLHLENVDWAVKLDLANIEAMTLDVAGTLAGQQALFQNMLKQHEAMHSLTSKLCQKSDLSVGQSETS